MIYTVGHRENYLAAIAQSERGFIEKTGKLQPGEDAAHPDGYPGGGVFQSVDHATHFLEHVNHVTDWDVWGVDADWDTDTEPDALYTHMHRLLRHARIIPLMTVYTQPDWQGTHLVDFNSKRTWCDQYAAFQDVPTTTQHAPLTCEGCQRAWLGFLRNIYTHKTD